MNIVVVLLSAGAGVAIFFSPCGVALLPSYISLILAKKERSKRPLIKAIEGLKIGFVASLGMLTVFTVLGIAVNVFGNFLSPYAFWFGTITGAGLILLGIFMVFGKFIHLPMVRLKTNFNPSFKSFFIFGAGYALGGIACTFPAFLLVVFASLGSGTFMGGLINFIAFSLAAMLLMILVTTLSAVAKSLVLGWLNRYMEIIQLVSALIIIVGGAYLIWFNMKAFIF